MKEPNSKIYKDLYQICKEFAENYQITCEESICQVDRINLALPELAEEIYNLIGYFEIDEEDY